MPCRKRYLNIKAGNIVDLYMIKSSRELLEEEKEYKKEVINSKVFLYLYIDYYVIGIPRGMNLAIINFKKLTHFFS